MTPSMYRQVFVQLIAMASDWMLDRDIIQVRL